MSEIRTHWATRITNTYGWSAFCALLAATAIATAARTEGYGFDWYYHLASAVLFANWSHRAWHWAKDKQAADQP